MHGLILADAYGIPSLWIWPEDASEKGHRFKYHDYYRSIGYTVSDPHEVTLYTNPLELIKYCKLHNIILDLDRLLGVCPFPVNKI